MRLGDSVVATIAALQGDEQAEPIAPDHDAEGTVANAAPASPRRPVA
jgi:hypothetical protein